uniref:DUF1758 domain-containing protein n=1 Tax=Meloidogyne enterolobii TaxID=390850 RepID=A0A6V7Y5Y3_MELEN|nr:unnamed protein product [Meloidogyne enterolobii]
MPSSGHIRRKIGLALRALKDHIIAATTLLGNEQEAQNPARLRAERHQLIRTLERIETLDHEWTGFIDLLDGGDLEAEEQLYNTFPPNVQEGQVWVHFMDFAEQARGIIGELDFLLLEMEERITEASERSERTRESQRIQSRTQEEQSIGENKVKDTPLLPDTRLPELKMEPFNGDPKKWPAFWQLFSINIDQRQMDNVRKMSYLLTLLQGPAKDLVAGFILSNENYTRALDLLKSRYGDNRAITEALESELMNLSPPNESCHSIRSFVDSIERICRQLEAFNIVDQSPFISTAIKSKLPRSIVSKLVEKERGAESRWNCAQLRKELINIVEIKEEVQRCTTSQAPKTRTETTENHISSRRGNYQARQGAQEQSRTFIAPAHVHKNRPFVKFGQRECSLCHQGAHFPSKCPKYPTPQSRFNRLKEQHRCIRCLREGHSFKECHLPMLCRICQGKHSFLVCTTSTTRNHTRLNKTSKKGTAPNRQFTQMTTTIETPLTGANLTQEDPPGSESDPTKTVAAMAFPHLRKKLSAYLMTRKLAVESPEDKKSRTLAYVFFDPGSQLSYITKDLVDKIRPPQISIDDVEVHGFGGTMRDPIRIRSPTYAVSIRREDGGWEELELNWTKEISTPFEMVQWTTEMPTQDLDHPEVQQALKISSEVPGIMLGTRHFWKFFKERTEVAPGIYVIQTAFGPVVGGESDMSPYGGRPSHSMIAIGKSNIDQMPPSNIIEEFWNLEGIGITEDPGADDDQIAVKQLESSIAQDNEGRYTVSWIWREPKITPPSNYRMVYSRLCSTYSSLARSKDLLDKYHQIIVDYLQRGIIEPARKNPVGQEHYLAHHAVITHKVRPVFDASAHPRGNLH